MFRPTEGSLAETESTWIVSDPIIPHGVFAVSIDNSGIKIGNGIAKWSELSYSGSSAIGSKQVQSDRNPVNGEHLLFCDTVGKWIFRPFACVATASSWDVTNTVFATHQILIETSDLTNIPTGRFKISDGKTACNLIPWFGNLSTDGISIGDSLKWNGFDFTYATFLEKYECPESDSPTGTKVAFDDGVWREVSDVYVSGPSSAISNTVVLFDGTTGKLVKDSGIDASTLTPSTGTPLNTFKINTASGPTLVNNAGNLDVKNNGNTVYANITVNEMVCENSASRQHLYVGGTSIESNSVDLTSDGTSLYVDGSKVPTQATDGHNSGFDADTLDGYHASEFATKDEIEEIALIYSIVMGG